MQLGLIGLGKMGANMTERLLLDKHEVAVFDINPKAVEDVGKLGAKPSSSVAGMVNKLGSPKVIWLMVPAGKITQDTIDSITPHLSQGDIIIDGGNSYYKDSKRRAEELNKKGINYLDCGTSGGIWGLKEGYCIMVGGDEKAFKHCESIFKTLAPKDGYKYIGPSGSGHFVKMIHNGIEYGMMEAYAEGFEIMHASDYKVDLAGLANLWGKGSVVRSWLLELLADALNKDTELSSIKGYVDDSGEGRWTVAEAIERNIPAPVITDSLYARLRSRQEESFSAKILAALRNEFGGHAVKKEN
ncbi:MAG: phosphogluconate dehydrogenase (NAD(+)-dependent, decarboxylating) [Ignavibacteria bacterium]